MDPRLATVAANDANQVDPALATVAANDANQVDPLRVSLPVDAGVQQQRCVRGQLGQVHHLGLLLLPVALVHPHVRESGGTQRGGQRSGDGP